MKKVTMLIFIMILSISLFTDTTEAFSFSDVLTGLSDIFGGNEYLITGLTIDSNDLVAHYKFENNVMDETGNENGVIVGDVNFIIDAERGSVANFDGASYIKFDRRGYPRTDTADTTSLWFNMRTFDNYIYSINGGRHGARVTSNGKLYIYYSYAKSGTQIPCSTYTQVVDVGINRWYHLVSTFEQDGGGGKILVYLDGELVQDQSCENNNFSAGYAWQFGGRAALQNFDGMIDDFKVYSAVLNESEIQELVEGEITTTSLTTSTSIVTTTIETTTTETTVLNCDDTDGGKKPNLKGTVTDRNGGQTTDLCYSSTSRVFEYYCKEDGFSSGEWFPCENNCNNGACITTTTVETTTTTIDDTLISHYKFEGNAKDEIGINHGYMVGNINFADFFPIDGNSSYFDGESYIYVKSYIPAADSINNLQSFTWSVWIRPSDTEQYTTIMHKKGYGTSWSKWLFIGSNNKLRAYIQNIDDTKSGRSSSVNNAITMDAWNYVVMTYDNTGDRKIRLYVNGQEVSYLRQDASRGEVPDDSPYNLEIGAYVGGSRDNFNGLMDNVKIWNRVLSENEILQEYQSVITTTTIAIDCGPDYVFDEINNLCVLPDTTTTINTSSTTTTTTLAINQKDMTKYENKEVFLISDENWRDVLPLVPLTTWTQQYGDVSNCQRGHGTPENVCVYPTLVYHEEDTGFDIDSSIYFMQQYSPDRVTIIGNTPQELDNLLIAQAELGAGLHQNQIRRINTQDYLSYWQSYENIVYVEDDYEIALLASTYASLINAHLVIEGTINDNSAIFSGRNLICIGSVSPSQLCSENYNLEQLQQKYVDETHTNKIILVNPDDLDIKITQDFAPEKSINLLHEIYSKTSLASPILASAKHEIILTTSNNIVEDIDLLIETKSLSWNILRGFLTIMGTSDAIESSYWRDANSEFLTDMSVYPTFSDEEELYMLIPGRIYGITSTDVFSYLGRVLFYDKLPISKETVTLAGDFTDSLAGSIAYNEILNELGYNSNQVINYDGSIPRPLSGDYENKSVIYYDDHGNHAILGIYSTAWPQLQNTFVVANACSTCIYSEHKHYTLMCAQALRKGAIGWWGMMEGGGYSNLGGIASNILAGKTIGYASLMSGSSEIIRYFTSGIQESGQTMGLLGDPSFKLNPSYEFPQSEIINLGNYTYELHLKVAEIPVKFDHMSNMGYVPQLVNADFVKYQFAQATENDSLMVYYQRGYTLNHSYISNHRLLLGIKIGPLPLNKNYEKVTMLVKLPGEINTLIINEEKIGNSKYVLVGIFIDTKTFSSFDISDTENLFETVPIRFKLQSCEQGYHYCGGECKTDVCEDCTPYGECSTVNQLQYCDNDILLERVEECCSPGCYEGPNCVSKGSCSDISYEYCWDGEFTNEIFTCLLCGCPEGQSCSMTTGRCE